MAAKNAAKTHKASKKRFRVTASGKLKRHSAWKSHLNSAKPRKRKRQLRKPVTRLESLEKKYVNLLNES